MTANLLRQHFDHELTEKQFQQAVVNLAKATGWRLYHSFRADHSPAGFPDLVLVRDGRLIFAELKRQGGRATPDQLAWLDDLRQVAERHHSVEAYLWRPSDWECVEDVLMGRRR